MAKRTHLVRDEDDSGVRVARGRDTEGSVITMLPTLTIERAAAKQGLDIFEDSIEVR
jgi:4-aminobutyrate aminotransferase-like enzyme